MNEVVDVSISIQPDNYFDPSQGNYHDSIQNRSCWDVSPVFEV